MRLAVHTRVTLLLGAILCLFVGGLLLVQRQQAQQVRALFAERASKSERLLSHIIELKLESVAVCTHDYSRWDEFVDFVHTGNEEWAAENLAVGPEAYGIEMVWVFDPNLSCVYNGSLIEEEAPALPPVDLVALRERLTRDPFASFFVPYGDDALEVQAAPIQPGSDFDRKTPAQGWFLAARRWTPEIMADVGRTADGTVVLRQESRPATARRARTPPALSSSIDDGRIVVSRPLRDVADQEIARLVLTTSFPLSAQIEHGTRLIFLVLIAAFLALMVIEGVLLGRWVTTPLREITAALGGGGANLERLAADTGEFGRVAALIRRFFEQQELLTREVAERTRLEEAHAAERDFIRLVIDHVPNPIWVEGPSCEIELANAAFRQLVEVEEPLGRVLGTLIPSLAERRELVSDHRFGVGNREVRNYRFARLPFREASGSEGWLGVLIDTTDAERAREEIARARDGALEAAQAKSEFLANISHELRTPMHGILSFARFGAREAMNGPREDLSSYFANIRDCGEGLLHLLNELLDLARLESGRMSFEFERSDLLRLVDAAFDLHRQTAIDRHLTLVFEPSVEEIELEMDAGRVSQVLRNLLSNAIKFSPEGGKIEVRVDPRPEWVKIEVEDSGVGIPEDELEAIFDKFVQSSKTKSGAGGTGLGLAISREIANAHGGRIWATHSALGGAIFHLTLPRRQLASGRVEGADAEAIRSAA